MRVRINTVRNNDPKVTVGKEKLHCPAAFALERFGSSKQAMSYSSSRLPDSWCSFLIIFNASESTSLYYRVTLTNCVFSSLLAPMTVVANGLILSTICKNSSLRTPSYVLLAGLALTDFCTGLLTQPFFAVHQWADLTGNIEMFCISGVITQSVGYSLSSLTVIVMTIMAVERWLHMSRRSLLTVRRVVILYITSAVLLIVFNACHMYNWYHTNEYFSALIVIFFLGTVLCFFITGFSYFKVFRIIRHHQSQIQTNQNAIDIDKYKKSVFTIIYILAIFLLTYVPFVCNLAVFSIMGFISTKLARVSVNACAVVVFSSSFVNPLLYYWRIKEIRDSVKRILRNVCCKESENES